MSMQRCPAGCIRPSASNSSTRRLFGRDHPLVGRRGAYQSRARSASTVPAVLSTQPQASASVTASS